jgi:hypothetical protein
MVRQIREGEMPLDSYIWMHPGAKLTDAEKQQLITGIEKTFNVTAPADSGKTEGLEHEHDED